MQKLKFAEDAERVYGHRESVTKSGLKPTSDSKAQAVMQLAVRAATGPDGAKGGVWSFLQGVIPPWLSCQSQKLLHSLIF